MRMYTRFNIEMTLSYALLAPIRYEEDQALEFDLNSQRTVTLKLVTRDDLSSSPDEGSTQVPADARFHTSCNVFSNDWIDRHFP